MDPGARYITINHSLSHVFVISGSLTAVIHYAPYLACREILEDLRERQALVSAGVINLETSFDDFRVVIGDGTL